MTPSRAADPVAGELVGKLPPEALDNDDHIATIQLELQSPAFSVLTEVGGCVDAYMLADGHSTPRDATALPGAPMHARARITDDGLTEVYLVTGDHTYLIVSGNVSRRDLAETLAAALSRP